MRCETMGGVWIGGGLLRSFFNNDPLKDVDLFFSSAEKADQWRDHMRGLGAWDRDGRMFQLNGIWYDSSITVYHENPKVIIAQADFTLCAAVISPDFKMTFTPEHLEHLKNRELHVYNGWYNPANSLRRAYEFIKKGYVPPNYDNLWVDMYRKIRHE